MPPNPQEFPEPAPDVPAPPAPVAPSPPVIVAPSSPAPPSSDSEGFDSSSPDAPSTPPSSSKRPRDTSSPSSLRDAIRAHLLGPTAKNFADVHFITKTGDRLPACRALLAIRSPYFHKLFTLPFAERGQNEVKVELSTEALNQVIHFAYTDTAPLLDRADSAVAAAAAESAKNDPPKDQNGLPPPPPNLPNLPNFPDLSVENPRLPPTSQTPPPRKRRNLLHNAPNVADLVELVRAADYVELPSLTARARDAVLAVTSAIPMMACAAFEAARQTPDSASRVLSTRLAALIRRVPHHTLGVPDVRDSSSSATLPISSLPVLSLSDSAFEQILLDPDLFTSETYLFQAIFYWATGHPLSATKRPLTDEDPVLMNARKDTNRWSSAVKLMTRVDLERLKPSFIVDYALPSGLVPHDRIFNTFMRQALEAERGRPLFDNFRGGSRWPGDNKSIRATSEKPANFPLDTPWISSGRHEWSFRIVRNSQCVWLGFARSPPLKTDRMFFKNGGGWAFSTGGMVRPEVGPEVVRQAGGALASGPLVWEGGLVKIILNLTKSGTFTVVVDGGPKTFLAFRELKTRGRYFLPVVCAAAPAEVELVGEKHLV